MLRVNFKINRLKKIRTLIAIPALCRLSYKPIFFFVGPVRFELTTPRLKAGYIFQLSYEPIYLWWLIDSNYQSLPYQRNALNHWAKSSLVAVTPDTYRGAKAYETFELPLLWTTIHFSWLEQIRTVSLERIRFLLCHWATSHQRVVDLTRFELVSLCS